MKKLLPFIAPILLLAALVTLHYELKNFHYHDIVNSFQQIPAWRVGLAVLLMMGSYSTLTGCDALAFRYIKKPLPYWNIAPVSFTSYALGHNIGNSLLTGSSIRFRIYSAYGLETIEITKIIFFCTMTFGVGYVFLAGISFAFDPPPVPSFFHPSIVSLRPIGYVLLAALCVYSYFLMLRKKTFVFRGIELSTLPWNIWLGQIVLGSVDLAFASSVLYILLPPELSISYPSFIGIYLLGLIAGLISQVPGGLGVLETMILVLLGEPSINSKILGSILIYRAIYYLLPLSLGIFILVGFELKQRKEEMQKYARLYTDWISVTIPHILSFMTLAGGCILLFSGSTPALYGRLEWLNRFVSLPILESSHFLGSIAGLLLILLARGIQRRIDAAYYLALILMGAGILLSLMKGLDYEEAIILAIMMAALIPSHHQFYRTSSLLREPFTPGWIASILVAITATLWIGFFSYKHVNYSNELWWHFSVYGDAPRFLRASVGIVGILIIVSVSKLLHTARHKPAPTHETELDRAHKIAITSKYTPAYLALTGDKSLLFGEAGNSFIMYGVRGRSWVAFSDPVGTLDEQIELIWTFRDLVNRHNGWTVFYQVSDRALHLYLDIGLTLLKLGEEARIPLDTFSLEGHARKDMRYAYKHAHKEGCEFEIVPSGNIAPYLQILQDVSDAWLREKNTQEKGFSLGHFDAGYVKRFPCAIVRHRGKIVAFANILQGADKEEISIDLMRYEKSAPKAIMDYLFTCMMLWGKEQGIRYFNMGMAPLSGLNDRPLSPLWNRLGGLIYRHGEHFYHFEGLREYKDKYGPVWEPKYLASPGGMTLPKILLDITTLIGGGVKRTFFKQ